MTTSSTHRSPRRTLIPQLAGLVLAAIVALPALSSTAGAQSSASAKPRDALVVSADWLAAQLNDPNLVLLHVGEEGEYALEHIPGARDVRLRGLSAARYEGGLALELDYAGLGARTSLLDGGMQEWKRAGHAVTSEAPVVQRGKLSPLRTRPLVVDVNWVKTHLESPGYRIVDARAPMFYSGPAHGEHRAGHVPGAANLPFTDVVDEALALRSPAELAALFQQAGVKPGDTVVAYCHIGQQATAVLFAARTLGYPVLLYDGSFEDWSRRTELPVEGGSAASSGEHRR